MGPAQQGPYILTHGLTRGPTLDHMRPCGNNGQWCIMVPRAMDVGVDPSCGKIVLSNLLSPDVTMAKVTAQAAQVGKVAPGDNPDLAHCVAFVGTRGYGY